MRGFVLQVWVILVAICSSVSATSNCPSFSSAGDGVVRRREVYDNGEIFDITHKFTPHTPVGISANGIGQQFRLGKFVQDINALCATDLSPHLHLNFALSLIAYGREGVEPFVWLGKSGLIDKRHLPALQKLRAWSEFVGYFGSVSLKVIELRKIVEEERCLLASIDVSVLRERLRKLREKKLMKSLSVVQDLADALVALADIRDGLLPPLLVSSARLLSALISTHKVLRY